MEIYIIKQVVKFGNVNSKYTLSTFDVEGVYLTREGAEKHLGKIFNAARGREGFDAYYGKPGFGTLKVVPITNHEAERQDTYILTSMPVQK